MSRWIPALLTTLALLAGGAGPAAAGAGTVETVVKDDAGKPLADAVVSLTPLGAPVPARRSTPAIMDQQDKEFVPHVLPVYVGTPVSFPNRDNIRHHVYSFSPTKRFELPLYIGTPAAPVVFDKPGVVVLGCNIHDWMLGYIYVLATPYFARTAPDGRARLGDPPPGSYEARVWHPRMRGAVERTAKPIALSLGEGGQIAFVVSLKPERRTPRGPGRYDVPQGN